MVRSESCHDEVLLEPARHIRRFRAPWKTREAARAFAGSAKTIIDKGSLHVASCPPPANSPSFTAHHARMPHASLGTSIFTVALDASQG